MIVNQQKRKVDAEKREPSMFDIAIEKPMLVSEMIYKKLKRDIITGEIDSDRLKDLDIANQNEISRTPVREALLRLTGEHLLSYSPRRGFKVRQVVPDELIDAMDAVFSMEVFAVKKVADTPSVPCAFDRLENSFKQYAQMMNQEDAFKMAEAYHSFHFTLVELAGNQWLRTLYSQYYLMISWAVLRYHQTEGFDGDIIGEHAAIMDAVMHHKSLEAKCVIEGHFQNLKKFIFQYVEE